MALEQNYNPAKWEKEIYQIWQDNKVGSPEKQEELQLQNDTDGKAFTILMPPPNLTGDLHAGHAFGHFLMDTLTRAHRQKGESSLWYPGVDHAGIQMEGVINKILAAGGKNRKDVSDEEFLSLTWEKANMWRDNQRKQSAVLGDTPDYDRNLFTLDDRAVKMVNFAFKKYYQDNLIYKGSYLVNWSVGLQTALSDVAGEIEYETKVDPFITFEYHFQALEGGIQGLNKKVQTYFEKNPIVVSTVRPETIFADVAIALHPKVLEQNLIKGGFSFAEISQILEGLEHDSLQIHFMIEPLKVMGVKLILSDKVDKDFGTGALKVTPAHDQVDYDLYREFETRLAGFGQAVGRDGKLTEICGDYTGMGVEDARLETIKALIVNGYVPKFASPQGLDLKKIDERFHEIPNLEWYQVEWDYEHNVTICERSKTVIEPLISEEFFLSYTRRPLAGGKTLQEYGLEGVQEVKFFSEDFRERGVNFLENIHDWCISRDLVWGHKMPVWYNLTTNPDKKFYSPEEYDTHYKEFRITENMPEDEGEWVQEEKILDTWFSSCLWPLSTLGYVENLYGEKNDFQKYYPTQVMTTAKEIFYQWIVRMIVLGKYFTNKIPFENLVITPTVLDGQGRKMSKSLKNGLEPVEAINRFSADSLRLGMLNGMIPNRNMKFGDKMADVIMEKNRNFGNKVWNIARFFEYQESQGLKIKKDVNIFKQTSLTPATQWILTKLAEVETVLENGLKTFELAHSVEILVHFLWDDFADWYVEYLKADAKEISIAYAIFTRYIKLLSPYSPFETEVIWREFFGQKSLLAFETLEGDLNLFLQKFSAKNVEEFENVVDFINDLRSSRGLFAIDPAQIMEVYTDSKSLMKYKDFVKLVAKSEMVGGAKEGLYNVEKPSYIYALDIMSYIKNIAQEVARTEKKMETLHSDIGKIEGMLKNSKFVENAGEETVFAKQQELEAKKLELVAMQEKLEFLR